MKQVLSRRSAHIAGSRYILLVATLAMLGLGLVFVPIPTGAASVAMASLGPSNVGEPGGMAGLGANAGLGAKAGARLAGTLGQPSPENGSYQAFGWIEHGEYGLDPSGEQIAFAITALPGSDQADGSQPAGAEAGEQKSIQAIGLIWNHLAGLDVGFELPPGLGGPLALTTSQITVTGLTRVETARLPATFTDRTSGTGAPVETGSTAGTGASGETGATGGIGTTGNAGTPTDRAEGRTHLGTVTFIAEGANDTFGFSVIDQTFVPAGAGWSVSYHSAGAQTSRLAQLSVSLDCPDLGIFQLVVADWEGDYVELFYGAPLQVEVTR